ncbi:MAG: hypothetical protein HC888_09825 [Candidatus Competibacteraceae bacterium]|nr:hypothetical protein [Candidatus Competibacteraceae bacterium]
MFFSKINTRVVELTPLSLTELFTSDYLPFTGLSLIALGSTVWSLFRAKTRALLSCSPATSAIAVFTLTLMGAGFLHRRLVVFAGLTLVYYLLWLVLHGGGRSETRCLLRFQRPIICFVALPLLFIVGGAAFVRSHLCNFSAGTDRWLLPAVCGD